MEVRDMQPLTNGFSVIERFGLEKFVLEMSKDGKTLREIADALCEHPKLKEEDATISHVSVGKWLKREREANQEIVKSVVQEAIKDKVVADLGMLDEIAGDLMTEYRDCRNEDEDPVLFGKLHKEASLQRKVMLANAIDKLVGSKMKYAGVGEGGGALEHSGKVTFQWQEDGDPDG